MAADLLHGSESLLLSELETSVLTLAVALFVGTFLGGLDSDLISLSGAEGTRFLLVTELELLDLELELELDFIVGAETDVLSLGFSGKSSSSSEVSSRLLLDGFEGFFDCLDGLELGLKN